MTTETMAEEAIAAGSSAFRGHPTIWRDGMWVYTDNGKPTPGCGGEVRPCAVCGQQEWSGDGAVDKCLGLLPGVSNACCGHGNPAQSYIKFTDGLFIRGFRVVRPRGGEAMTTETILTDEQIDHIIDGVAWPNEEIADFGHDVARAIEQAVLQSPEVQAWKRDAERYRHVAKSESDGVVDICICRIDWSTGVRDVLTGDQAHALVDAAMEKQT